MSKNSFKVARWEFTQNATSKGFLMLTFAVPIIIVLIGFVPNYLANRGSTAPLDVYIAGNRQIYGEVHSTLDRVGSTNLRLSWTENQEQKLEEMVKSGEIDGYLRFPALTTDKLDDRVSFYVRETNDSVNSALGQLNEALNAAFSRVRLEREGYEPERIFALTQPVNVRVIQLEQEDERGFGQIILPLGIALMIVLSSVFSGSMVMTGIVQEKRNRIVEIIMSSIDSFDMMMGKLMGFAGLGIAQLILWGGAGLITLTLIGDVKLQGVSAFEGFYYFGYFALGYLMIASLYTLLGASSSDIQSSGQARGIFVLIPILPIYFTVAIVDNPDALWVKLVSFVPIFTPTMMLIRSAFGSISVWEVLLSLAVLGVFVYFAIKVAAKIFRVGMLMYGKDMSFKQIWKWARK